MTARERFMKYVLVQSTGCWEWTGSRTGSRKEYGQFSYMGRSIPAHRASHLIFKGDIPSGFHVDHLCRNTICANPNHLEAVTPQTNLKRQAAAVEKCPQGHPYDGVNTYREPTSGKRHCRPCHREHQRAYLARKAAA